MQKKTAAFLFALACLRRFSASEKYKAQFACLARSRRLTLLVSVRRQFAVGRLTATRPLACIFSSIKIVCAHKRRALLLVTVDSARFVDVEIALMFAACQQTACACQQDECAPFGGLSIVSFGRRLASTFAPASSSRANWSSSLLLQSIE